jgi:hypothetical protein
MPTMPPQTLSDLGERILLALWRLRGIGNKYVKQEILRADLGVESDQSWVGEIANLQTQGFLTSTSLDGQDALSLAPLGLAILRQIEEDRLQELK